MAVLRVILTIIYIIVSLVLIAICFIQSKDDEGASATVVGGASSSFYEKNKGRTTEGKLKKWTIILGIVYIFLVGGLGILYML